MKNKQKQLTVEWSDTGMTCLELAVKLLKTPHKRALLESDSHPKPATRIYTDIAVVKQSDAVMISFAPNV